MLYCLKCKTRMRLFAGASMISGLEEGTAGKIVGYDCPNCHTWIDLPLPTVKPRYVSTENEGHGNAGHHIYSGMTSKQYGIKIKAEVERHFSFITILRTRGWIYDRIVADLNLTMSRTTCERYMTVIRKERGVNGYINRNFASRYQGVDLPAAGGVGGVPEKKPAAAGKVTRANTGPNRRVRHIPTGSFAHAREVSL
jgi:hypothetical protein